MSELPGVGIVIGSYNYAQYVGAAIESALAQDHPKCEVIVVDDCSTDNSREVIEQYSNSVRTVFLNRNGGHAAALNAAWPLVQHEVLIFLDADDVLEPHAASTLAKAWAPGVAKIQFPMRSIDAEGNSLHHFAPKYRHGLTTETLRKFLLETGTSPSTPGTGNAYSKWFLTKISPIEGLMYMDMMLEINAPFHGEVVTLMEPLACYRIHSSNYSQFNQLTIDRFSRQLQFYEDKLGYLVGFFRKLGLAFDPAAAQARAFWYLERQIAASRLSRPDHPRHVPALEVVRRSFGAMFQSPYSVKARVTAFLWIALVGLAPQPMAERLLDLRFNVSTRPRWMESIVSRLTL